MQQLGLRWRVPVHRKQGREQDTVCGAKQRLPAESKVP